MIDFARQLLIILIIRKQEVSVYVTRRKSTSKISSKMLHNLIVPLPSIDEQERIVAFIDKLFEQIESIEKSFS